MRTLVDIPDRQINELAAISSAQNISRAELIRRAISSYISLHCDGAGDAFGIWKERPQEGLAYQERIRSEW